MRRWIGVCIVAGLGFCPVQAGQLVKKANSVERVVRYDYAIVSRAERAQDIRTHLSLPRTNVRQEVSFVYPEPGYERIVEDEYGNRVAVYVDKGVKPGEVRRHGWMAAVKTYAAVFQPSPDAESLGKDDAARYTRDTPKYLITDPVIVGLRDSLARPGMTDYDKAFAVFDYFVANVTYFRDDKWDTAPEVIQRKQGSCSEYTYSYIALMRSFGIPCRYTGGVMISTTNKSRYDEKVHEDAVFHRWAEVYLKGYGWFPVDGSKGAGAVRRFGNSMSYWGQLNAECLQTYCGDGGGMIDWDYIAAARGEESGSISTDGVCFWIDTPADGLEPAVKAVEKALDDALPAKRLGELAADTLSREVLFLLMNRVPRSRYPHLAEELLKVRHPAAVYLAVYCEHLDIPVPSFLAFPMLVDDYLRAEIIKHRLEGRWDWRGFEHWWRKARPEISFAEQRKLFALNNRALNLN